jgi:hypothetical protein
VNDQLLQHDGDRHSNAITSPISDGLGDGFADDGAFDPLAGLSTRPKAPTGVLILGGVVILAAAGLWSMKFIAKASARGSENQESVAAVEAWLSDLSTQNAVDLAEEQIRKSASLAVLSGDYSERAIPLRDVQRNPFILFIEATAENPVAVVNEGDLAARRFQERRLERMQSVELAASGLELKMVLGGKKPLANINGKIVGVNDEVAPDPDGVVFTIRNINANEVLLGFVEEDFQIDMEFTLSIDRKP